MIPIEKLCITLEQAKKLKELGVVQESHFYWGKYDSEEHKREWTIVSKETKDFYEGDDETYSAFTIGELYTMNEKEGLFRNWYNGWSKMNHYYGKDEAVGWYCTGGFGCGKEVECSGLSLKDALYKETVCYIENVSCVEDLNDEIKSH